jgi:uncharacterized protein (DUF1800 family)
MTDFWFNHFNIALSKNNEEGVWVGAYEETAIRPFALGKFRDILGATAHHAAMINYLDNRLNTAPNSPLAGGQYTGINENYARELMELHTLGVDGGYTQKDVQELARILTGLGLPPNLFGPNVPENFDRNRFAQGRHGHIPNGTQQLIPKGHGIWERPGYDKQWQRAAEMQQYAHNHQTAPIQRSGHYPGAHAQIHDPAVIEQCIGPTLTEKTKTVVWHSPETLRMTLLLGSPEFMRY